MAKIMIVSDIRILSGKPVIAGTRISVELIMNFLASGMSIKDILHEYSELKKNEVTAAIEYATKLVSKITLTKAKTEDSVAILHEIAR